MLKNLPESQSLLITLIRIAQTSAHEGSVFQEQLEGCLSVQLFYQLLQDGPAESELKRLSSGERARSIQACS